MSGLELVAVFACVGAIISAYHDGAELVAQIKARRKARKALQNGSLREVSTDELALSLHRGEEVVQGQYEFDARRLGDAFSTGDQIARDSLKDIIIHIQRQIISNLKLQWQQETMIDFSPLQDASDSSQNQVLLVLIQLQQRILVSGAIENMRPPPLFYDPPAVRNAGLQLSGRLRIGSVPTTPPWDVKASQQPLKNLRSYSGSNVPPPPHQPERGLSSVDTASEGKTKALTRRIFSGGRSKEVDEPHKRTSSNSSMLSAGPLPAIHDSIAQSANEQSISSTRVTENISRDVDDYSNRIRDVDNYPNRTRDVDNYSNRRSTINSLDTCETDLEKNPWAADSFNETHAYRDSWSHSSSNRPDLYLDSQSITSSSQSCSSQDKHSIARSQRSLQPESFTAITSNSTSISRKDLLPSQANKFSGFCKGAWRLQIGDKKKAMDECHRPDGIYSVVRYWQCSKCKFEGRLIQSDKKTKGYDKQVIRAEGIQFRWEFLFKSHVQARDHSQHPMKATYACIFCCSEGRGTPTFGGAQIFMEHLQEHRMSLPTGEVLYRMNCIAGREAQPDEDFDINLIEKEGRRLS
ncbi:MAG: hypothetical protein Q9167_000263 [Letrouitia subvulpina]